MKIKLSDYVAKFIAGQGVDTVFAISGGASLHLIHSVHSNPHLRLVCPHHEQAAAMGADGYARVKGDIGVAVATSGPGATNLITGICCSFYDSVPVLFITGQVSTFRTVGDSGVRQIGFQETPTVDICRPVTKYAVSLADPNRIRYELEKAVAMMRAGRQGPAVVDIPDNLQRALIDEDELETFEGLESTEIRYPFDERFRLELLAAIAKAQRPVVIAGWGIHLARVEEAFLEFVESLNLPVALTWGAADLMPEDHPLNLGRFGTHGMRHTNFAVQNADLILSLGSRLDTKATGSPVNTFARGAYKVMVDIDANELAKFDRFDLRIDLPLQVDLREFFERFTKQELWDAQSSVTGWSAQTREWKRMFSAFDAKARSHQADGIDPYLLFEELSASCPENTIVTVDTGCSIAWSMQAWGFKAGQRIFHDYNNTAMGWALPAANGAWFARGGQQPILCVVGDGSFMMSMQELATVLHHSIPVKIILMNNSGYSMIRQTQEQWLDSDYVASSRQGGISFPNFSKISESFGLHYIRINRDDDLIEGLRSVMSHHGPLLCEVIVSESARVIPQVKFGRPNEDMEPLLPREVLSRELMIPENSSKE
jgi:acetolactate synthase-1/2/3 large subunit